MQLRGLEVFGGSGGSEVNTKQRQILPAAYEWAKALQALILVTVHLPDSSSREDVIRSLAEKTAYLLRAE